MSVPDLNRIALIVQKLLGGPKISKVGHVTLSHAHLWVVLWSVRSRGPSSMSVPNVKRMPLFVQSYKGVLKFEIGSRDPKTAPFEP